MGFRWFEYGLIGAILGFLSQDIIGSFCVVHTLSGSITYTGFIGCANAVFQKTALSLIFVGIPLAILTAINSLFKQYWLKGGMFALLAAIILSFFLNFNSLINYIIFYFGVFIAGILVGFIIGKLFEKEEEFTPIKKEW